MFHMLAFGGSQPFGVNNQILPAIPDAYFTIQSNAFQIPQNLYLKAIAAMGINVIASRVNTPSLRLRGFPHVMPFIAAVQAPTNPNVMDFRDYPLVLRMEENFELDTSDGGAANSVDTGLAIVSPDAADFNVNVPDLRWVRATFASITAVVNRWSGPAAFNFEDTLEGGVYNIYGLECNSANLIAARLILQNQYWRPGTVGMAAKGLRSHEMFRGGLGLWGQFNTYSVPQIEVLETTAGADTTLEAYLLIAKAAPYGL